MSLRALVEDYRVAPSAADLQALGAELLGRAHPVSGLPTDPVDLWLAVESREPVEVGTWQEVRVCRDEGLLTPEEYEYLSALYDAKSSTPQELS